MAGTDLEVAIAELFSSYEKESLSDFARKLDSDFEQHKHQFDLMRYHVSEGVEDGDLDGLRINIENKLAVGRQRFHAKARWWSPVAWQLRDLPEKIQKTVEKSTAPKPAPWHQWLHYGWKVFVELICLGIVIGVFAAATSTFETLVFAILILIYSKLSGIGVAVHTGMMLLTCKHEEAYGEIGRTLRIAVPISRTADAVKEANKSAAESVIHLVSVSIGSLITIGHLVVALLK